MGKEESKGNRESCSSMLVQGLGLGMGDGEGAGAGVQERSQWPGDMTHTGR